MDTQSAAARTAPASTSAAQTPRTVTVTGTAPAYTGQWISPSVSRSVTGPVERVVK